MKASKKQGLGARFGLASETPKHRTVATIDGEVGAGKTYFGFTGPAPVVSFNIDQGTEGVVEQFRKDGKEIYEETYVWIPGDPDDVDEEKTADLQELAIELRNKFEKDFAYAIANGARTLVVDTESRFWQMYRYAEFGSPKGDNPRDFDEVNQRFEAFINKAKAADVNLLLMRSMKDKWGMNGKPNPKTGKKSFGKSGREVWGYEHLPGLVFMELTFVYDEDEKEYKIKIGKCRHNVSMQFDTIPRCSFAELGTLLIEGSTEDQWQ